MPSKSHNERRALASELLGLERKIGADLAKMDDIKRGLREIATEDGLNFTEEFAGEGRVKVAGKKEGGKLKGILPELVADKFLTLSERRRETLIKSGLIQMTEQRTGQFNGSVTVDVF